MRLVCVNDVYSLDNLPRLRTLVRHYREASPADVMLTTLAGDFVAPSLLSSLDHGAAMIACLNAVPITHVCFGNHEQGVPPDALVARIREFHGTWLNTNVPASSPRSRRRRSSMCAPRAAARCAWASSGSSPKTRRSIARGPSKAT